MMTMPGRTYEIGSHLPTEEMSASARQLGKVIRSQMNEDNVVRVKFQNGSEQVLEIDAKLAKLLVEVMELLEEGEGVTFVPISKRLTTQQAADILNVSRPYLIKVLDRGDLAFHTIGRHRRILARDLFEYKRLREANRSATLKTLIESDGDLY